jgi:H+-transporting ATPase
MTRSGSVLAGLSEREARERLARVGPNVVAAPRPARWRALAGKFWGPVPWLVEAALVLELVLGHGLQAGIFGVLLAVNAVLAFVEEDRAQRAVQLLRQQLQIQARVRREGVWREVPAAELVPGDVVHLRQGDLVPADVRLGEGGLEVDQSALTGESLSVSVGTGGEVYAGALVARGEATGVVQRTGSGTLFGRTAELVRTARAPGHLERLIVGVVRWLVALDVVLVVAVVGYGLARDLPARELLPFTLILIIASVPVALPATFTLATTLGSRELSARGVLVTRLAAIEDAAAMTVVCTDKTGTITQNRLSVTELLPYPPYQAGELLRYGALASEAATQDPLDMAVLAAAGARGIHPDTQARVDFTPFDPATKRSQATWRTDNGLLHTTKGAPQVLATLAGGDASGIARDVARLAGTGARVLAVAADAGAGWRLAGLLALSDPPRPDSASVIGQLHALGARVIMATGDSLPTARAVADQVGITGAAARAEVLRKPHSQIGDTAVYGEVLPEDKLRLVQRLQHSGQIVGMTGDGVNDAPALRQAEVGIAVASATDVAKAAASLVLTSPGLDNILTGIRVSRRIHQRMLTYTLNKIIKTLQMALFLALGLLLTGRFVTTPALVVLLLLANDFVTMSIATDRVSTPTTPQRWAIRPLVAQAATIALPLVALSFGVWWYGQTGLRLPTPGLQTLTFVWLVFSGQATVYLVRQHHHHFWHTPPSRWLAAATTVDLLVVSLLATQGWLMAAISPTATATMLGLAAIYLLIADQLKVRLQGYPGARPPSPWRQPRAAVD